MHMNDVRAVCGRLGPLGEPRVRASKQIEFLFESLIRDDLIGQGFCLSFARHIKFINFIKSLYKESLRVVQKKSSNWI